jgi:hypothetical protein
MSKKKTGKGSIFTRYAAEGDRMVLKILWDGREDVSLPPQLNREWARALTTSELFVVVRGLVLA